VNPPTGAATVVGMTSHPVAPQVLKLTTLVDIVSAIPYSLGFQPAESMVAVALKGPRERLSFTMRLDLLPPERDAAVARECAERMKHAKARSVFLVVYTSPPRRLGDLPRHELVEHIQTALPMPLRDAALVAGGRVWSYLCAEPDCCPPEGHVLSGDSPGAVNVAAAHALVGDALLPSREALVATTTAVGGVTAASMRQAIERALDDVVESRVADLVESSLELVDRLCAAYADGPVALTHDTAAQLALRAHNVEFRDVLLGRLARGDDALSRLVSDLARLAQPPYDAPAATMLGVCGYFRGDGVVGLAAAERALTTDPDYSLAKLLAQAIGGQLDPRHMRRICAKHRR
jgi:hypothetical protein